MERSKLRWMVLCFPFAYLVAYIGGYVLQEYLEIPHEFLLDLFDGVWRLKAALIVQKGKFGDEEAGRVALTFILYGVVALAGGVVSAICGSTEDPYLLGYEPDVSWVSIPVFLVVLVALMMTIPGENISHHCSGRGSCFWKNWPVELAIFTSPVFFGPYFWAVRARFQK